MAGRNGNNNEDLEAEYLEYRRKARNNDAATSAFNIWENEVRKRH